MRFFDVKFILQKFCSCKKNDKYEVCLHYESLTGTERIVLLASIDECRAAFLAIEDDPISFG